MSESDKPRRQLLTFDGVTIPVESVEFSAQHAPDDPDGPRWIFGAKTDLSISGLTITDIDGVPIQPAAIPTDDIAGSVSFELPPEEAARIGEILATADRDYRLTRALEFVACAPPAISGQNGHATTYRVLRILRSHFALDADALRSAMDAYNARCEPPWSPADLSRLIRSATA